MSRILSIIFILCTCLVFQDDCIGQQTGEITFDRLTPDDGLSQSTVYNMLQDREGYMWFATQDGLNRYDGYRFTAYLHDPGDPESISYNRISTMYEDSNGTLWVGTLGRGLNRYNRDLDQFEYYPVDPERTDAGYYGNSVNDILEDSFGNFWIGKSNGLFLMDRETGDLVRFTAEPGNPNSLTESSITKLFEDSNQTLWVGTRNGLNRMNREEGTFRQFQAAPSNSGALAHPYIYSIHEDSSGQLWIGTRGGGLHRYREDTETFQRFQHDTNDPNSISGNSVSDILEDPYGSLWIATENNGLNRFDRSEETFFRIRSEPGNPSSLNTNSLQSLFVSDQNRLWVGTFDGGINTTRLDSPQFEHYKPEYHRPRSLSHPAVLSFGEDSAGNIWVGTDGGGLNRFDQENGEFTTYRHIPNDPNSLSSDIILEIFEGPDQRLWLGTYQGGISLFDIENQTFTNYRHDPQNPESLSNNEVWIIYEDRDGVIWIGTCSGGLNRFDAGTETFRSYMHDPDDPATLNNNFISSIFEDSRGRFWVGTYGGGLSLMNRENGTFTHYTMSNSDLSDNVVVAIHEDSNSNLWIATKGGGLNLFNSVSETFSHYTTSDGLPNNVVHGILEDDRGYIWLSTNNGLSRFQPDEEIFTNYNLVHGLQSREYKEGSFFKDREGYFYFGGINGFNRFDPGSITAETRVPPVVLTDFRIFNNSLSPERDGPLEKQINRAERITIPYDASVLTFEFAVLDFDFNKNNQYAYMLEEFDSDWNYVGRQRSATYTNLNPGEYTFRVRAANRDGVWGEADASVALIITPPFWRTTWFFLFMGIFIAGTITTVWRSRVRSITEQNRRLEEEVRKQTSRLFDKNKDLNQALKDLKSARGELIEKAHKAGMADLATNVLHNVGNILNSVNISANLIDQIITNSRLKEFRKANMLLEENLDNLEEFILNDPRGMALLRYFPKLEQALHKEHDELKAQKNRLSENVKLIVDVVASQQDYSKAAGLFERVSLETVVEDTLKLQAGSIERHSLNIETDYQKTDPIEVEKSKLIHTLVNLLKNAKEAMAGNRNGDKRLAINTWQDEESVYLSIRDNGEGIQKDHLGKVFNHGFTTRDSGHGFGLHSCAFYMQEIGGDISVASDGPGKGTIFTLEFPKHSGLAEKQKRSGTRQELIDDLSDL